MRACTWQVAEWGTTVPGPSCYIVLRPHVRQGEHEDLGHGRCVRVGQGGPFWILDLGSWILEMEVLHTPALRLGLHCCCDVTIPCWCKEARRACSSDVQTPFVAGCVVHGYTYQSMLCSWPAHHCVDPDTAAITPTLVAPSPPLPPFPPHAVGVAAGG